MSNFEEMKKQITKDIMEGNDRIGEAVRKHAVLLAAEINSKGREAQLSFLQARGVIYEDADKLEDRTYKERRRAEETVSREDGLKMIEEGAWELESETSWKLEVKDKYGWPVKCYIEPRPVYCDRGHLQLFVDGALGHDSVDFWTRYFFSFDEAAEHCKKYLKWRLWKKKEVFEVMKPEQMEYIEYFNLILKMREKNGIHGSGAGQDIQAESGVEGEEPATQNDERAGGSKG